MSPRNNFISECLEFDSFKNRKSVTSYENISEITFSIRKGREPFSFIYRDNSSKEKIKICGLLLKIVEEVGTYLNLELKFVETKDAVRHGLADIDIQVITATSGNLSRFE